MILNDSSYHKITIIRITFLPGEASKDDTLHIAVSVGSACRKALIYKRFISSSMQR